MKKSDAENNNAQNQQEPTAPAGNAKKYKYIVIAAILAFFASMLFFITSGNQEAVSVSAGIYDETGAAPNTSFLITLPNNPDLDRARGLIAIEPMYAFNLAYTDQAGVFELTTHNPLEKNSQLTITAAGRRFDFTVRNELIITSVFPADGARGVPVNSSLVLTFNSDSVIDLFGSMAVFRSRDGQYEDFRVLPQTGLEIHITPTYPLRPDTFYNIVISPPLEDAGGAQLMQPFEFTFFTAPTDEDGMPAPYVQRAWFELSGNAASVNVIAGDIPVLAATINSSINPETPDVSVIVRAFDGWERFYAALDAEDLDTQNMPVVAEFENIAVEELQWRRLLVFPEALPIGWYHIEVTASSGTQTTTDSILMQVSDISVFYMTTGDEVIVWAHDINTGQPLSGADVNFSGDFAASGRTNGSGVAQISGVLFAAQNEELDMWSRQINKRFTVTHGDRVFVAGNPTATISGDLIEMRLRADI